ncbi:MAG: hypothetical protein HZT43_08615 [Exiguobacterium profundum]|nr:MAG: hypothetical protein HZT43_08615 [Exiguobacterium profundum]
MAEVMKSGYKKKYVLEQFPFVALAGIICLWLYAGWSRADLASILIALAASFAIYHIARRRWRAAHRKAAELAAATEQINASLPRVFRPSCGRTGNAWPASAAS